MQLHGQTNTMGISSGQSAAPGRSAYQGSNVTNSGAGLMSKDECEPQEDAIEGLDHRIDQVAKKLIVEKKMLDVARDSEKRKGAEAEEVSSRLESMEKMSRIAPVVKKATLFSGIASIPLIALCTTAMPIVAVSAMALGALSLVANQLASNRMKTIEHRLPVARAMINDAMNASQAYKRQREALENSVKKIEKEYDELVGRKNKIESDTKSMLEKASADSPSGSDSVVEDNGYVIIDGMKMKKGSMEMLRLSSGLQGTQS